MSNLKGLILIVLFGVILYCLGSMAVFIAHIETHLSATDKTVSEQTLGHNAPFAKKDLWI